MRIILTKTQLVAHKGICSLCCICVDNFISETVQRVQSSFFLSFWNCPVYLFTCFSLEVKCYVNYAFPDIWIMYESPIAFTSCHKIPKYPPNFWYFFNYPSRPPIPWIIVLSPLEWKSYRSHWNIKYQRFVSTFSRF